MRTVAQYPLDYGMWRVPWRLGLLYCAIAYATAGSSPSSGLTKCPPHPEPTPPTAKPHVSLICSPPIPPDFQTITPTIVHVTAKILVRPWFLIALQLQGQAGSSFSKARRRKRGKVHRDCVNLRFVGFSGSSNHSSDSSNLKISASRFRGGEKVTVSYWPSISRLRSEPMNRDPRRDRAPVCRPPHLRNREPRIPRNNRPGSRSWEVTEEDQSLTHLHPATSRLRFIEKKKTRGEQEEEATAHPDPGRDRKRVYGWLALSSAGSTEFIPSVHVLFMMMIRLVCG